MEWRSRLSLANWTHICSCPLARLWRVSRGTADRGPSVPVPAFCVNCDSANKPNKRGHMLDGPHAHHEDGRSRARPNDTALNGMRFDSHKALAVGLASIGPLVYAAFYGVNKSSDQLLGSGAAFTASALGYLAIAWNEAVDATVRHVYVTFVVPIATLSGFCIGRQSAPLTTSKFKCLAALCGVIFCWSWLIRLQVLEVMRSDSAVAGSAIWSIVTNCCIFGMMMAAVVGAAAGFWTLLVALLVVPLMVVPWMLGSLLWSATRANDISATRV